MGELSDIGLERQARLEALNRAALRSQIIRIREIFRRLLHEDNYADQTHTHPLSRARDYHRVDSHGNRDGNLDTSACAYRRWGSAPRAASPASKPADTGGLKYWVKRHLQTLGRALANLASKASAALNGIIGLIVSWLLGTLGKPVVWLAENLWAVDVNAVTLFLMAAQDWLTQHRGVSRPLPHDKQNVTRASAIPAVTRAVFFFFLLHGPLPSFVAVAAPQSGWKPPPCSSASVRRRRHALDALVRSPVNSPGWWGDFPWNTLSPLAVVETVALIGSDSFIPGLWPISASDPAIMTSLL